MFPLHGHLIAGAAWLPLTLAFAISFQNIVFCKGFSYDGGPALPSEQSQAQRIAETFIQNGDASEIHAFFAPCNDTDSQSQDVSLETDSEGETPLAIHDFQLSPTGSHAWLWYGNAVSALCDLPQAQQIRPVVSPGRKCMTVFSKDGKTLVLAGLDTGIVHVLSVERLKYVNAFLGVPLPPLYEVSVSVDGQYIACRGFDGFGSVHTLENGTTWGVAAYGFAFGPGNLLVYSNYRLRLLEIIKFGDKVSRYKLTMPRNDRFDDFREFQFDVTGKVLAAKAEGTRISFTTPAANDKEEPEDNDASPLWCFWDASSGNLIGQLDGSSLSLLKGSDDVPWRLTSDGRTIIVGCKNHIMHIDWRKKLVVRRWDHPLIASIERIELVKDGIVVQGKRVANEPQSFTAFWQNEGQNPVWWVNHAVNVDEAMTIGLRLNGDGDLVVLDPRTGGDVKRIRCFLRGFSNNRENNYEIVARVVDVLLPQE